LEAPAADDTVRVLMKSRDVAAYIFLAIVWGASFVVLLQSVLVFGWVGAAAFRSLIAAATLYALARLSHRPLVFGSRWQPFAVVGATIVVLLICMSFAAPRIGTAMTAILIGTTPLFSAVLGRIFGSERTSMMGLLGLVLGLGGVVLLVGFPAVPVTWSFVLGSASALVAAFASAYGGAYAHRFLANTGSWEVSIGSFGFGGVMMLPLLLAVPIVSTPAPIDYLYLSILGCVMSALCYVIYYRLIFDIGATRTISVEFPVTLVAVLIGCLFLDEPLSLAQIVGGAIVMVGCLLVLGIFEMPLQPLKKRDV
jgi:drug/metabolite transporter (DMT)-like permease